MSSFDNLNYNSAPTYKEKQMAYKSGKGKGMSKGMTYGCSKPKKSGSKETTMRSYATKKKK